MHFTCPILSGTVTERGTRHVNKVKSDFRGCMSFLITYNERLNQGGPQGGENSVRVSSVERVFC